MVFTSTKKTTDKSNVKNKTPIAVAECRLDTEQSPDLVAVLSLRRATSSLEPPGAGAQQPSHSQSQSPCHTCWVRIGTIGLAPPTSLTRNLIQDGLVLSRARMSGCSIAMNSEFRCLGPDGLCSSSRIHEFSK